MTIAPSFWIDSHCHPHFPPLGADIAAARKTMEDNQTGGALAVATKGVEREKVLALVREHRGFFWAACGVHPLSDDSEDDDEQSLLDMCGDPDALAVGETGLDFFRGHDSEAMQRRRFAAHIAAARRLKKPLIIHTRDSQKETLDMLRAENARDVGGVLHCFTGGDEEARAAREINFMVSFSGILTFKKSEALREVARKVPADGFLVETDAPYLAPVPHRGKVNTPGYVRHVGEAVAAARNESPQQTAAASSANFVRLFSPPAAEAIKNRE